jgi:hypothetical protein
MVETITPMVHGGSRARGAGAVAFHTVAATVVAGAFGGALGAVGRVAGAPWGGAWWPVLTLVAAAAASHELVATPFPIPQLRRQVPNWWRTFFGPYVAAALYGGALGVGFLTFVTRATLVVVASAAVASGEPLLGGFVMVPFGFARGIGAVAAGAADPQIVGRLARVGSARWVAVVNAVAVAFVAVAAVGSRPAFGVGDAAHLAAGLLAAVFAWSAAWKLVRPSAWRRVVASHRLGAVGDAAAIGAPAVEVAVPVLYLVGRPDLAAAGAASILLAGTAAVILARIRSGPRLACGCFGDDARDFRVPLARNAVLAAVAVLAWTAPATAAGAPTLPGRSDALPIAFVVVGGFVAVWTIGSVRRALRSPGMAR